MITQEQYRYLQDALKLRPTAKPRLAAYPLNDGHTPIHQQCQITAMHLEQSLGWGAQIGIQWLDKGGRLLPWPHVVNWVDSALVDYSCPILETKLGFTLIGNDSAMANALTISIQDRRSNDPTGVWADPLLTQLHHEWFKKLKRFSFSHECRFDPSH